MRTAKLPLICVHSYGIKRIKDHIELIRINGERKGLMSDDKYGKSPNVIQSLKPLGKTSNKF